MGDFIVRGSALLALADYPQGDVARVDVAVEEFKSVEELVHDSTAAQLDYLVESGELKAEDVYEAESKVESPRKGVLAKYKPESE